jgi:hypothetical protein
VDESGRALRHDLGGKALRRLLVHLVSGGAVRARNGRSRLGAQDRAMAPVTAVVPTAGTDDDICLAVPAKCPLMDNWSRHF